MIANYANPTLLGRAKVGGWRHAIGFVGISPRNKRFDLALDLIGDLRQRDPAFHLYVKGRRPEEYAWMRERPEELAWYEDQYRRIAADPILTGGVTFDPYGDDMPDWYAKIGFALSVSDFESFHLTIADGAETGAVPLILPWVGADRIYPAAWISPDLNAMAERAARLAANRDAFDREAAAAMAFARERFALDRIFRVLEAVVVEEWEAARRSGVAA